MTRNQLISQTAEYALRALSQLATLAAAERLSSQQLSELTGIPQDYLSKVLRKLVSADLIASERGHGGGFRLNKPADQITFSQVFCAVGFELSQGRCAFGWSACNSKEPCPLHDSFKVLLDSFERWASSSTLLQFKEDETGFKNSVASKDQDTTCPNRSRPVRPSVAKPRR